MNKAILSVLSVTAYLLVYIVLININVPLIIPFYMLVASPVLLIWMIYAVLKDGFNYPELSEEEEWGYRDKAKEDLDIF